jgi:hypothetical protein
MLAAVSGGQAGNTPGPNAFQFSVDPEILTKTQNGFAQGIFTAASGQAQGSATNVKMIFTLPAGFTGGQPGTSSGCTAPPNSQVWTCNIGTVNAGGKRKRFLVFKADETAPSTPPPFEGCVTLDGGSGGAGGGGGTQTCAETTKFDSITVAQTASKERAGNCTGDASTAALSKTNSMSTNVEGEASESLGLPCTWSFVGVKGSADTDLVVPQVAFMGFPQTDADAPVTWNVLLASRPSGPFENLDALIDLDYTAGSTDFTADPLEDCVDLVAPFGPANEELPAGKTYCLVELVKVGAGARATFLILGFGGDPGAGWG